LTVFQDVPGKYLLFSGGGSALDVVILREREKKWIYMLDNWPYFMNKKYDKVKERCRKGIPPSLRGRAWKYLCGAAYHIESGQSRNIFDVSYCVSI
jgi:hypothetical protein